MFCGLSVMPPTLCVILRRRNGLPSQARVSSFNRFLTASSPHGLVQAIHLRLCHLTRRSPRGAACLPLACTPAPTRGISPGLVQGEEGRALSSFSCFNQLIVCMQFACQDKCCEHYGVGCDAEPYDCVLGLTDWQAGRSNSCVLFLCFCVLGLHRRCFAAILLRVAVKACLSRLDCIKERVVL